MADYLMHYGILGMRWGVRRYQNEDGSLTEAGKRRYATEQNKANFLTEKARQATAVRQVKDAERAVRKANREERAEKARARQERRKLEAQKKQADEEQRRAEVALKLQLKREENTAREIEAKAIESRKLLEQRKRELALEKARIKQSQREARAISKRRGILSNEEIQARINRLKMEKELRELTNGEVNRGREETKSILKEAGRRPLVNAISGLFSYGIYGLAGGKNAGTPGSLADALVEGKVQIGKDYNKDN